MYNSIFTKIVFFIIKEMKGQNNRKKWILDLYNYDERDPYG
jgi:hypothetical protein